MKITIYTLSNCPFCKSEKEYLTRAGVPFEEKKLEDGKGVVKEMLSQSDGFRGVPFTIIVKDDGSTVKMNGFTQADFDRELGKSNKPEPVAESKVETPAVASTTSAPEEVTSAPLTTASLYGAMSSSSADTTPTQSNNPAPMDKDVLPPIADLDTAKLDNTIDSMTKPPALDSKAEVTGDSIISAAKNTETFSNVQSKPADSWKPAQSTAPVTQSPPINSPEPVISPSMNSSTPPMPNMDMSKSVSSMPPVADVKPDMTTSTSAPQPSTTSAGAPQKELDGILNQLNSSLVTPAPNSDQKPA